MIIITLNPDTHPSRKQFDKSCITVGSGNADIVLSGEKLEEAHVKVWHENGRYYALNAANDPFVTLNGTPFGKKMIKSGDLLQIGDATLRVDFDKDDVDGDTTTSLYDTHEEIVDILKGTMERLQSTPQQHATALTTNSHTSDTQIHYTPPLEELIEQWNATDDFSDDIDIESLVKEVEELEWDESLNPEIEEELSQLQHTDDALYRGDSDATTTPDNNGIDIFSGNEEEGTSHLPTLSNGTPMVASKQKESETHPETDVVALTMTKAIKKDATHTDSDEEDNGVADDKSIGEHASLREAVRRLLPLQINWRLWGTMILIITAAFAAVTAAFYYSASGKSGIEEIKAARGVADISMALAYAQVHNVKPQKSNWTESEFLKNNLSAVLPPNYLPLAVIDSQGQISDSPYYLRIYTNNDLDRFLVIAQPEPSVMQWLFPKSAVVVDSSTMEMHKVADIKSLNRLLVNPRIFEGSNGNEITALIKSGELISVSGLQDKGGKNGFNPPRALGLIRPGAEEVIYNAPRYYLFGERILAKAKELLLQPGSSKEVELLRQEIDAFARFYNLVLYSTSIHESLKVQKAISTFVPQGKFLFAYLKINNQGRISNGHLVLEEEQNKGGEEISDTVALAETGSANDAATATATNSSGQSGSTPKNGSETTPFGYGETQQDSSHPFYLKLAAAAQSRSVALKAIADDVNILLTKQTQGYLSDFSEQLAQLVSNYEEEDREGQNKIFATLLQLYHDYSTMPMTQMMVYVRMAAIETLVDAKFREARSKLDNKELSKEQFNGFLEAIDDAKELTELESSVQAVAEVVTLENLFDPAQVIIYQKITRSHLADKLDSFLTSSDKSLPVEAFDAANRTRLTQILKKGWVTDPDVIDFYLSEFDYRAADKPEKQD